MTMTTAITTIIMTATTTPAINASLVPLDACVSFGVLTMVVVVVVDTEIARSEVLRSSAIIAIFTVFSYHIRYEYFI